MIKIKCNYKALLGAGKASRNLKFQIGSCSALRACLEAQRRDGRSELRAAILVARFAENKYRLAPNPLLLAKPQLGAVCATNYGIHA